ncbi:MAG: NAD(P)H-hydrate dehydratase [Bacteroidaceae bacterium]|nr:NAD(P)H-hydrate dehydratase [Bacteroidaceae bacterium]
MATDGNTQHLFSLEEAQACILPRKADSHKGTFGHGLLVAGSKGMAGAALMAARSCLRSGIGLLTVATPECNRTIVQEAVPEAMVRTNGDWICAEGSPLSPNFSACAIGPGLGTYERTKEALSRMIEAAAQADIPTILDADALNILSLSDVWWENLPHKTFITPHPGEFNRLLRPFSQTYNPTERQQQALMMAKETNVCVILKGNKTVVALPDGRYSINPTGNAGMATGGSGDVLTGILLALCAQGYALYDAARLGVFAHGLAGDVAAEELGQISLVATDIIRFLPKAWKMICGS